MCSATYAGYGKIPVGTGHSLSDSRALISKFHGGMFHSASFGSVNLAMKRAITGQLDIASNLLTASFKRRRSVGKENSKAHSDAGGLGQNRVRSHLIQPFAMSSKEQSPARADCEKSLLLY